MGWGRKVLRAAGSALLCAALAVPAALAQGPPQRGLLEYSATVLERVDTALKRIRESYANVMRLKGQLQWGRGRESADGGKELDIDAE